MARPRSRVNGRRGGEAPRVRFLTGSEYGVGVGLLLFGVLAFALALWGVSGDPPERSE
jgi:hypothetical protein